MKMTMNIDDDLLGRVMKHFGVESKTRAVELALREMDRRSELVRLCTTGLGLSADELKESFDSSYDLEKLRSLEKPVHYGRKSRPR